MDTSEEGFIRYLQGRNRSASTIHVYTFAVTQFFSLFDCLCPSELRLYKVFLLEHYKPQTVNQRIRAMNCFLEYRGISDFRLTMVRVQQKPYLDHIISAADYEYLKNCLKRDQDDLYYYIVRFLAATGVRVSELVQFQIADVETGWRDIYSKDNKSRRIYIPTGLQHSALSWLRQERRSAGFLFLNRFGDPISPAGIRKQLKQKAILYGLDPQVVYPHSFRHRFAKNFIENCGDIALLSDLLGHESIETTRIYLRRSSAEQQKLVNELIDW